MSKFRVLLAAALLVAGSAQADPAMQARIEAQMNAADRHKFDPPRDAARKPYQTFRFLGLQAGMTALSVWPTIVCRT